MIEHAERQARQQRTHVRRETNDVCIGAHRVEPTLDLPPALGFVRTRGTAIVRVGGLGEASLPQEGSVVVVILLQAPLD